jgi:glycosyltransferase involved in cell wall biosynthesis
MKVLMLVDPFHPCPQSSSQRLLSFAKSLRLKGFKVTVITGYRCLRKTGSHLPTEEGLTVYDLKCPFSLLSASSIIINPFLILLYFFFSIIILLKERADIVFASVPNGETAIAGFFVSKIFKIPFVMDMRDLYPFPSAREILHLPIPSSLNRCHIRFFRFLHNNSDIIVCVYKCIKRELTTAGIPAEKMFVVTNGADTSIYRPCGSEKREAIRSRYKLPLDKLIFVYAGTLTSYYPTHDVIKGFSKLYQKQKNLQLLIISFKNYDRYKRMAEELELENAVKFMGPLPVVETAEILSACDVGIVSYPGEDFLKDMYGAKIFSYMSCGLPILASGPPGGLIEDLVRGCRTGFFVGKPCESSFARGFSFFLNNKSDMKIMGENGRKLVEERYDRKMLGLKLASLLHELSRRKE